MPLLILIMALVIVITVMGILLVISWEKPSQASQLPNSPNEPVDTSHYEESSPRDGILDVVLPAEESTTPPDFDWAQSHVSDIFDYN